MTVRYGAANELIRWMTEVGMCVGKPPDAMPTVGQ
jgi:hypothetical protein